MLFLHIWTKTSENVPSSMWTGRSFRSACEFAHSDQNLHWAHWRVKDTKLLHVNNENSEQIARIRRLIWIFIGLTCKQVRFLTLRIIWLGNDTIHVAKAQHIGTKNRIIVYLNCSYRKHAYIILTPLKPHVYPVKLGFTGVYINFHISARKNRLWVLVRTALSCTHNLCFEYKYEKHQIFFLSENFPFLVAKCSIYLNKRVFIMLKHINVIHIYLVRAFV